MGHKVLLFDKGTFYRINIQNMRVLLEFTPDKQFEKGVSYKLIEKSVRRLS
jgi:hypothetical protein